MREQVHDAHPHPSGRGSPRGVHEAAQPSANALALALRVPPTRIGDILRKAKPRAISADTAVRLAHYFSTLPELWLTLQSAYELSLVLAKHGDVIKRDVQPRADLAA